MTSATPDSELIGPPVGLLSASRTIPYRLVSLGTFAFFVAWLAFACYALADLASQ